MDTFRSQLPSGLVVEFRRPGPFDATRAVGNVPTLAQRPFQEYVSDEGDAVLTVGKAIESEIFDVERLCICTVNPKFTTAYPPERGRRHISSLKEPDYRKLLADFRAFDTTEQEAADIGPLSQTVAPSKPSTTSGGPTGEEPASSSAKE
jgi:hypothetical protein